LILRSLATCLHIHTCVVAMLSLIGDALCCFPLVCYVVLAVRTAHACTDAWIVFPTFVIASVVGFFIWRLCVSDALHIGRALLSVVVLLIGDALCYFPVVRQVGLPADCSRLYRWWTSAFLASGIVSALGFVIWPCCFGLLSTFFGFLASITRGLYIFWWCAAVILRLYTCACLLSYRGRFCVYLSLLLPW
jgi:hypothetical protein